MKPKIVIKRVYEEPSPEDGCRILVDRLWPRGLAKKAAELEEWVKELAPSTSLRIWFGHRSERWQEFGMKYKAELLANEFIPGFLSDHSHFRKLTLLYGAKDKMHTHALVLQAYLNEKFDGY